MPGVRVRSPALLALWAPCQHPRVSPRQVLSCLATLLRKLVPWNKLVMRQAYQHLLSFTLHAEPQVSPVVPWPLHQLSPSWSLPSGLVPAMPWQR